MLETIFSLATLWWLLLFLVYLPCCVFLIIIVLLQKGKGAGFAGAFGLSPGSESVFGPKLARTLPQKLTYVSAGIFMVLAILLSALSGKVGKGPAPELIVNEMTAQESASLDSLFENQNTTQTSSTQTSQEDKTTSTNTPVLETNVQTTPSNTENPTNTENKDTTNNSQTNN